MRSSPARGATDPLPLRGQRILVCGKGGSGKSTLVALLAKSLAARGYGVVALDGDASNPGGLARLLLEKPAQPRPLIEFFGGREHVECPVDDPSPLTRLGETTPVPEKPIRLEEIPAEYKLAEHGITLLRVGKITRALEGCEGPMSKVTRDLRIAGDAVTLIDVEAGIEHFGRGVEKSIDTVVVVVDPTFESLDIADRIAGLCRQMGVPGLGAVVNRARPHVRDAMAARLRDAGIPLLGALDPDDALEQAGLEGRALPLAPVAVAVGSIVGALEQAAAARGHRPDGHEEENMPMTLQEALLAALDDEYRARATYRAVLAAFGDVRPFVNVVESEERHVQALGRLCERYGVDIPADPWPSRVSAPESLEAACQGAIEAERENRALYDRLMDAAGGRADVEETFRRLLTASQENHLPAFERALERERRGGVGRGRTDGGHRHRRRHRGGGSACRDPERP